MLDLSKIQPNDMPKHKGLNLRKLKGDEQKLELFIT